MQQMPPPQQQQMQMMQPPQQFDQHGWSQNPSTFSNFIEISTKIASNFMIFVYISFSINQNLVLGNPMPMQQMGQMQMQFNPNMPHNGMKGWSKIFQKIRKIIIIFPKPKFSQKA